MFLTHKKFFQIFCASFLFSLPFSYALAQATPTLSIQALSPGSTVSANNEVYFTVTPSYFSNTPSYTLTDSFGGSSSLSNSNINSSGVFVWIPTATDAGTHNITITGSDQSSSASVHQQIIVNGPPTVSIQSLSPGASVNPGQTIFFSTVASGFTNPTFSVNDSLFSSTLLNSNINSTGNFSWTPKAADTGTHVITVVANDSLGNSASASQSISVGAVATATIQSLVPGTTVSSGQNVTFNVVPTGFTNPTYSVTDSFYQTSLSNYAINNSGAFSWTPTVSDIGTHTITIQVSDSSGNTAQVPQIITVQQGGITISAVTPNTIVQPGTTISFSATTTGFINPVYSVVDTLSGGSLNSSAINSSGVVSWTPIITDIGNHVITVRAIDGLGHVATGNVTITVTSPNTTVVTPVATTSSSTSVAHTFSANLSLGSTGADVTALQNLLTQKGFYSGPVTGYYGNLTVAAVMKFQTANGISSIGSVGPATRAALNTGSTVNTTQTSSNTSTNNGYKFYNPLSLGSSGTDVTELQKRLTAEGIYNGPITGYYGLQTSAAVKIYQKQHGLAQLGNVGPGTRAALDQ